MRDGSYREFPVSLDSSGEYEARAALSGNPRGTEGLHYPIYGNEEEMVVTFSHTIRSYDPHKFVTLFPKLILFIVPLYGPYVYAGSPLEVQNSIKKFAVDFGSRVGRHLIVFDYWTEATFDLDQYERQSSGVMKRLGITEKSLPAIVVSNRNPLNWPRNDSEAKAVVLSFQGIAPSAVPSRIAAIASDLKTLQLPNKWDHSWAQLRSWSERNQVLGGLIGSIPGLIVGAFGHS
jgi:hypothetical protein